mgnify:CR=1 FL=1
MCLFRAPDIPEVPPPPPAPPAPMKADVNVDPTMAAWEERRRQRLARGYRSTLLTSWQGLANKARTWKKSLLGQ